MMLACTPDQGSFWLIALITLPVMLYQVCQVCLVHASCMHAVLSVG